MNEQKVLKLLSEIDHLGKYVGAYYVSDPIGSAVFFRSFTDLVKSFREHGTTTSWSLEYKGMPLQLRFICGRLIEISTSLPSVTLYSDTEHSSDEELTDKLIRSVDRFALKVYERYNKLVSYRLGDLL